MEDSSIRRLRVAAYIRVSSDEQAKYGDSLRDQRERALDYISGHPNMALQNLYIDDGISGQKLDRDEFSRLLESVKAGEIDLIIFTKLDRWFRSLRHYLNTQAVLEEHRVAWIAIDQPYFDTSTPHGRAFVAQSMMWAELEAQNDSVRIRDVFASKVKYGEAITGKVPRGYRIENKHLVLSSEAEAVRDSISYFLKTQSLHQTILYMKDQYGIVMTPNNLRDSILRNPKYTGRYRENECYCPRLITDECFEKIQKILDQGRNIKSGQRYPYLFSGLLLCGACGRRLCGCHIHTVVRRSGGKVYRYRYPAYECRGRHKESCGFVPGPLRESKVEGHLLSLIQDELDNCLIGYRVGSAAAPDGRREINVLQNRLTRLKELYLNGAVALEEYQRDRAQACARLEALAHLPDPPSDFSAVSASFNQRFGSLYPCFTEEEKRLFWRSVVREIRVRRTKDQGWEYTVDFL